MSMADEAYACAVVGCDNPWNHHSEQRVTFTVRLSRSVYRPVTIRAQIPLCDEHHDQGDPRMTSTLSGDRDGDTFDAPVDRTFLNAQMIRVYGAMMALDMFGEPAWLSLQSLATSTGDPEASVSARLRDFRKPRFGGHTVDRRRDGRLYLYRLTWNDDVIRPTDPEIGEAYYGKGTP